MKEDEVVGWHHWLDGHQFEQALGRTGKDWEAWCVAVRGVTKSWTWLSDWTELSSFSKLNNILLYVDIRLCLSLYPWMDTWAVSTLWRLWKVLLWTCCSSVCSGLGFWFSWVEPRKWYVLLNHLATPFGTIWGTAMLTFKRHIFTYAFNCEKNKWTTFQISVHPSCFSNWAIFTRRCEKQTYYLPCCC